MWSIEGSRNIDKGVERAVEEAFNAFMSRTDLGFFRSDLVSDALKDVNEQKSFFSDKKKIAVIGVGGSSLGTKALCDALSPGQDKIHFLDNVDVASVDQWLNSIDPKEWGWIMVSKSGGTMEVLSLYDYCYHWVQEKCGISIIENTAVVTEEKESEVKNFAAKSNLLSLPVPMDVGGRFSAFTAVGLFPYSFLAPNLSGFEEGCKASLESLQFVKALVGQLWQSHKEGERILYSFQYSDRLTSFGLWLQQLWSESLGKKIKLNDEVAEQVATIVSCRGASDQHSVLQQIMEGPEKKFVCFHRVESSERGQLSIQKSLFEKSPLQQGSLGKLLGVEASATQRALNDSQVGTMVLKTEDLSQQSISFLMMSWMLAIGVLGELLEINAFDQPGVESGKAITRRVLSQAD